MIEWDQAPSDTDWERLAAILRAADSVVCVAHVSPDGDAIGSALAVSIALDSLGITAVTTFDASPFQLPESLAWLPRADLVVAPADLPPTPSVVIACDASDLERLGALGAMGGTAGLFAAIDHHRSYTGFAALSIVDATAPATAVIALELVDRLGVDLTTDIATCIYAGLTTDTGSFRFFGTTSDTHRIAARLHEAGITHDEIARRVFDTHSLAALRLLGLAIDRAKIESGGGGLVWTWVSRADREVAGLPLDAAEAIIDTIRTVAEAEVAVVCKEGDDGVWRVSSRSKGAVDLGAICSDLGGGGHQFAAGFSSTDPPEQIIATMLAHIA